MMFKASSKCNVKYFCILSVFNTAAFEQLLLFCYIHAVQADQGNQHSPAVWLRNFPHKSPGNKKYSLNRR